MESFEVKELKIYTKTGDAGETGLIGGRRVAKDDLRMEAIGTIDELNAHLGLCATMIDRPVLAEPMKWIQNWLFDVGAELATPAGSRFENEALDERHIGYLEESIDLQQEELPELKQFILPGGGALAGHLHLARAVCRRAERCVVAFSREQPVRDEVLAFLNRLSDWLFVAARTANRLERIDDVPWTKSDWSDE